MKKEKATQGGLGESAALGYLKIQNVASDIYFAIAWLHEHRDSPERDIVLVSLGEILLSWLCGAK